METNEVKSRLLVALKNSNGNTDFLAQKLGISPKILNSQLYGNRPMSLNSILCIADVLPEISLDWLLRGKGEMVRKDVFIATNNTHSNFSSDTNCNINSTQANSNNVNSQIRFIGANTVTGKYAKVIGQQIIGLSAEFVRELLAAKDKQIQTLLALLKK